MSAAKRPFPKDQFLCSICLDVFTDPVTTPCGHNFCKNCITQHWDSEAHRECPDCNKRFKRRPELQVNSLISEMASRIKKSTQQRAELGDTEAELQQMIQQRQLKIVEFKQSVKVSRENAGREKARGDQVLTRLRRAIKKRRTEAVNVIQLKHKLIEKQAKGFIKELEQEISQLKKKSAELKQLSLSEDHLLLLRNLQALKAAPPTKDWTEVRVRSPSYEGNMRSALAPLVEMLLTELNKLLPNIALRTAQQSAVDVTLDPDTANPTLILSADGKQVHHADVKKKLPDNPKRFSRDLCVVGKQVISAGRFYFEVQVKGKTCWVIGVANELINRKGPLNIDPQNGYWTLGLRKENEYYATAGRLDLKSQPEKVGVFVDYEEGLVLFYDVDAASLIHALTDCCFTERLLPFLYPAPNKSGKNSAPLIIRPVKHRVK
ncbi:E3 ubiquitin-protein ligase TRIM39-like [Acanthopagrus latus]|uniref:E3 ubiquitin-protein ligase TRIM39-like n=1 Tax=Acanthopagrus latus TaxID=8177 RepID=UPI00187C949C|nr:E3 ubiquitin-protein ligase TRIM39-like [Acanthopagrus latus]